MDWATSGHTPGRTDPAAPQLLELVWQVRGPSGKLLACGIYRTAAPGLEVRVGYSADNILKTVLAPDLEVARAHAADWRRLVLAKGSVKELPTP
jgi:hypothetical protein